MELIERDSFIAALQQKFSTVATGEGHCIFLSGEPGIGKTSLIRAFCTEVKNSCKIYQGACDALFTPRPLAALYDIALQTGIVLPKDHNDRTDLFTSFFHQLENEEGPVLLVIEDIHWADEATLDFIKYLSRRITQLHCLVIFTYRDNEVHARHPLTNVLGQLPPHAFSRMVLTPLSKQAVNKLAEEKGYEGEDVYRITCGNPFYVSEILASYHSGIPVNIRDSILSAYNRLDERAKNVWDILSVLPTGFEVKYLETMDANYLGAIHFCLEYRILVMQDGMISFKHELFRRAIENSLSPFLRVALNKKILELFKESFEKNGEIERIIHHAKNANEYELVVNYAPLAAKKAAALGAHLEAFKLYFSAIEYYQGNDAATLIKFYDAYAYECYLTSQIKEAIIYATKSFELIKKENDAERKGGGMCFLSRLWWLDGNKKKAQLYALQAVELFADLPTSPAKAMAFSNMSQLNMLADEVEQCLHWGKQAIAMAKELNNEDILSHALNNIGTSLSRSSSFNKKGNDFLQQSLQLALKNNHEEHVARAYTNIGSCAVAMKDYESARTALEAGIRYGEERDLGSWTTLMFSRLSRMHLETGNYSEAYRIAESILTNHDEIKLSTLDAANVIAKIKMRRGDEDVLPLLLEAKSIAIDVMELRITLPVMITLLEYEWITEERIIEPIILEQVISLAQAKGHLYENSSFAYWLFKARNRRINLKQTLKHTGCPYEQALDLFEGDEEDKRKAIDIIDRAGATAVFEKMKFLMRRSGIRQIPRGIRKTTRANTANLTGRELDILHLLKDGLQNKEIACKLFISPKTVDHHISSIIYKLEVNSRTKAVEEAANLNILK